MRALREAFPDHKTVLAAPAAMRPLVELADVVDRLLPTEELQQPAWSTTPPDLAVNLHGRGPQTHELLLGLGPRRLVAFDCPQVGHSGPVWTAREHEVLRWCRLLDEALGIPVDPDDLLIAPPPSEPLLRDAVVIHPGAAYASRQWPPERFAEVARWATDKGCQVVVTGGEAERSLAEQVRRLAGLSSAAALAGRTDLMDLAALVASARLVVCGDTGMAHLASAFRTPSVVLFGPTPPALWGPPARGPHHVLWRGDGTGDPWADQVDPSLLLVSVQEVIAASNLAMRDSDRAVPEPDLAVREPDRAVQEQPTPTDR